MERGCIERIRVEIKELMKKYSIDGSILSKKIGITNTTLLRRVNKGKKLSHLIEIKRILKRIIKKVYDEEV